MKFIFIFLIFIPSLCFSQVQRSASSRLDALSDLPLCMYFAGMTGDQYANLEIFKRNLLRSTPENQENILLRLEAQDARARQFIANQQARAAAFREAQARVKNLDPSTIPDPVLKDLVILLQR